MNHRDTEAQRIQEADFNEKSIRFAFLCVSVPLWLVIHYQSSSTRGGGWVPRRASQTRPNRPNRARTCSQRATARTVVPSGVRYAVAFAHSISIACFFADVSAASTFSFIPGSLAASAARAPVAADSNPNPFDAWIAMRNNRTADPTVRAGMRYGQTVSIQTSGDGIATCFFDSKNRSTQARMVSAMSRTRYGRRKTQVACRCSFRT